MLITNVSHIHIYSRLKLCITSFIQKSIFEQIIVKNYNS